MSGSGLRLLIPPDAVRRPFRALMTRCVKRTLSVIGKTSDHESIETICSEPLFIEHYDVGDNNIGSPSWGESFSSVSFLVLAHLVS